MPAAQRVRDPATHGHPDEAGYRRGQADPQADLIGGQAEAAPRIAGREGGHRIADESVEPISDHHRNEGATAEGQGEGRAVAAPQRVGPGKDGIDADPHRGPLRRRLARQQHQHRDGASHQQQDQHIADQRMRAAPGGADQRQRRDDGQQFRDEAGGGRRRTSRAAAFRLAPDGFAQRRDQDGEDQPRHAHGQEGGLPPGKAHRAAMIGIGPVPSLDDQPADEQRQAAADIDARRIDGERRRSQPRREPVGNQRIGGRAGGRLADPDADARARQGEARPREAGQGGHRRPER